MTKSSETAPRAAWWRRAGPWALRGYEIAAIVVLLGLLAWDRTLVFREYLLKFADEDQQLQWYAARELLQGRIHEPCFFGQAYNSCVEGFLAAPLVWCGMAYKAAVPLVSVLLGLAPYLALAWVALRRRQPVVAAIALAVPLLLETRFAVVTGMPRGFVTGLAAAMVPAILFLPPRVSAGETAPLRSRLGWLRWGTAFLWSRLGWLQWGTAFLWSRLGLSRRTRPAWRYFVAAFFAVVALMLNPNCAVLLAAVAVYAVLTTFREWRFWVYSLAGLIAAAPYPAYVYKFYYEWHKDYVVYPFPSRAATYGWGWDKFNAYVAGPKASVAAPVDHAFGDLLPTSVTSAAGGMFAWLHGVWPGAVTAWCKAHPAPAAMAVLFGALLIVLACRLRVVAVIAGLCGVAVVIVAFGNGRVADARPGVAYSFSRMMLAVPVLWVWLMLLKWPRAARKAAAGEERKWRRVWGAIRMWGSPAVSVAAVALLVVWGVMAARGKASVLGAEIVKINKGASVASPVKVAELERIAAAIQKAAGEHGVSMVVVAPDFNGKKWAYGIPVLTTCETLFASFERRTWRMVEENVPRHERVLVLGGMSSRRGGGAVIGRVVSTDPPLTVVEMAGKSVIEMVRANRRLGGVRAFDEPEEEGAGSRPAAGTQPAHTPATGTRAPHTAATRE